METDCEPGYSPDLSGDLCIIGECSGRRLELFIVITTFKKNLLFDDAKRKQIVSRGTRRTKVEKVVSLVSAWEGGVRKLDSTKVFA